MGRLLGYTFCAVLSLMLLAAPIVVAGGGCARRRGERGRLVDGARGARCRRGACAHGLRSLAHPPVETRDRGLAAPVQDHGWLATLLPLRTERAIGRRGYVPRRVARIRDAGGIGYDDRELRSADRPGRDDRRVAEHDDRQLRARSVGPGL